MLRAEASPPPSRPGQYIRSLLVAEEEFIPQWRVSTAQAQSSLPLYPRLGERITHPPLLPGAPHPRHLSPHTMLLVVSSLKI